MLLTSILSVIATLLFFSFMDIQFGKEISTIHSDMEKVQTISFVQFIPPILLVLLVLFRLNIILSYLISILSASLLAMYNNISILEIVNAFWHGVEGLGGGLIHMYSLLIFIAVAGAFNALLEELNVIQPILDKWLNSSTSMLTDSIKTIIASLIICIIAGNQTMPIILTGRSFLSHWSNKYGKDELVRIMGDTTLLFPAMIPWNILAIMSSTVINMNLITYLPYAIFLWILPCLTIIISMAKRSKSFQSRIEVSS